MKKFLTTTIAAITLALMSNHAVANCGSITMADMNWPSATLMANVDKIILEEGYGCEIELVAGATTTTFASMNEKGQPDVAAELWINAVREPLFAAMDEGNWISNELSGYSVDNIAPVAPQNVNASYLDSESIEISWTENEEQDLGYYKVFRDITSTFDANEENFIESTNQNQFIDNNLNGETYYYKVRAIDTHDNQSESSVFVFAQSLTGDINFDFTVNVLDIVALVDIVIDVFENDYNPTDAELGLLDIYPDGLLNVIDIVGLVNIVLNQ